MRANRRRSGCDWANSIRPYPERWRWQPPAPLGSGVGAPFSGAPLDRDRISFTFMRNAVVYLLSMCLCAPAAFPADNTGPLRGYSNDSARAERDWEAKFRAIPDAANLRAYMERLAKRP